MKFTEGYWLRSERFHATYASQAFVIEALEDRLRVVAPARVITSRDGALDVATITTEFYSVNENTIGVRSWHFSAYNANEPRFALSTDAQPVTITENEDEAVMTAGKVTVRVNKREWGYQFEAGGRVLTSCGFRNLGHMLLNKPVSTMFPAENYLTGNNGDPYMVTELALQPGECVYGMGERFTAFVKNGQVVDIWNEDGGTSSQIAYKNIPFYLTNKGYGVFVDHTGPVSFEVASEKVEYVGFSVPGEEIRYHLIYGETPKEVLQNYTAITGRPALPPAWTFGLWLSTSFTTDYSEETTTSFIEGMAERELPLSVFHYDCYWMKEFHWCDFEWDEQVFPDVKGMLARAKERGLHLSCWINPYVGQDTAFFKEAVENGYLLQRADGRGVKQLDNWQPGMGVVDFTNPAAVKWYTDKLRSLLEMGVDAFKTDFAERIPVDVVYHNGMDPLAMHNYYTFIYNQTVFNLLKEVRGEGEAVLFARSATAGCQQFPVHWSGDNSASYPSMAETLRGGLSFTASGFSFWSHDIGGFEMTSTPDLYKRWVQFGMFSTHSRLHGSKSYRVPWNFDDESSDVLRYFTKLKHRLMPYIYGQAANAHKTGVPVMRAMVLEFCGDPAADTLDRQYMLGESLLVAPIFNDEGKADWYLPEGTWTHLLTGETKEGGRWYNGQFDYFSLPVYVRPGTLLPFGGEESRPDYDYTKGTELRLYALADGASAKCEIPGLDGEAKLVVNAARQGNTITITANGALDGNTVVLCGIDSAVAESGDAAAGEQGCVITPAAGAKTLTVTLG